MSSLYRVIPESSQVRLPAGDSGRDSATASFYLALQAIRSSRSCKRNARCNHATRRHARAELIPVQMHRGMHVAVDAARVLRLSNSPMPYAGEA